MVLDASWNVIGIVTELRELKSEKNKAWRGYIVRVASLGATFELQASAEQFSELAVGMVTSLHGRFDEQGGRQRLIITKIEEPPGVAA
jgi:hypothetical protein